MTTINRRYFGLSGSLIRFTMFRWWYTHSFFFELIFAAIRLQMSHLPGNIWLYAIKVRMYADFGTNVWCNEWQHAQRTHSASARDIERIRSAICFKQIVEMRIHQLYIAVEFQTSHQWELAIELRIKDGNKLKAILYVSINYIVRLPKENAKWMAAHLCDFISIFARRLSLHRCQNRRKKVRPSFCDWFCRCWCKFLPTSA